MSFVSMNFAAIDGRIDIFSIRSANLLIATSMLFLSGCAALDSIHRSGDLLTNEKLENKEYRAEGQFITTDAKQRIVTYMRVSPDKKFQGRVAIGKIVCAEPSPDVAQALQQALTTSFGASSIIPGGRQASLSGNIGAAAAESIAQLGKRIATIQLLRDELADLCRSFANGAVSTTTYTVRLSRLDKKMITLLMGEAAAGALNQPTSVLAGNAGVGSDPTATPQAIAAAEKARNDALAEVEAASEALKNATTDEAKLAKRSALIQASQGLIEKEAALTQLLVRSARVQASATMAQDVRGGVSSPVSGDALGVFPRMQRNFLDDDDLGTILDACIDTLGVGLIPEDAPEEVRQDVARALSAVQSAGVNASDGEKKALSIAMQNAKLWSGESQLAQWCLVNGMPQVVNMIQIRDSHRHEEAMEKSRKAFGKEVLERCGTLLADDKPKGDESLIRYCRKALDEMSLGSASKEQPVAGTPKKATKK